MLWENYLGRFSSNVMVFLLCNLACGSYIITMVLNEKKFDVIMILISTILVERKHVGIGKKKNCYGCVKSSRAFSLKCHCTFTENKIDINEFLLY